MAGNSKKVLAPYKIISAGDVSGSLTGKVTNILYLDNICFQVTTTGTPTGTIAIQGSLDYAQDLQGNVTNTGNWIALTPSPAISQPAGSATSQMLRGGDLVQCAFPYIRLIYTASSGTGTLTAYIGGKAI